MELRVYVPYEMLAKELIKRMNEFQMMEIMYGFLHFA